MIYSNFLFVSFFIFHNFLLKLVTIASKLFYGCRRVLAVCTKLIVLVILVGRGGLETSEGASGAQHNYRARPPRYDELVAVTASHLGRGR